MLFILFYFFIRLKMAFHLLEGGVNKKKILNIFNQQIMWKINILCVFSKQRKYKIKKNKFWTTLFQNISGNARHKIETI